MDSHPTKTKKDVAHTVAKGLLAGIPGVGGLVAELFDTILSAPIDRRKKEWLVSLASSIEELEKKVKGFEIAKLADNELFISVVMQASAIAIRNHQAEKLIALKNAVMNSAATTQIDSNKALIFTRLIDQMTPLHMTVLMFLNDPMRYESEWGQAASGSSDQTPAKAGQLWDKVIEGIKSDEPVLELAVTELETMRLIDADAFNYPARVSTTSFGKEFVSFVSSPI